MLDAKPHVASAAAEDGSDHHCFRRSRWDTVGGDGGCFVDEFVGAGR